MHDGIVERMEIKIDHGSSGFLFFFLPSPSRSRFPFLRGRDLCMSQVKCGDGKERGRSRGDGPREIFRENNEKKLGGIEFLLQRIGT